MLSRVAEAVYWMSRNLERAEHIARFIEVNWHLSLDLPMENGHASDHAGSQWRPLVMITGEQDWYAEHYPDTSKEQVIRFLAFDADYGNSIRSCLRLARENARTVRDALPPEMWEQLNIIHHQVEEAAANPAGVFANPFYFCESLKLKCLQLGGLVESTVRRGEAWHFFQLGRMLERADKTSRILDVKYFIILPDLAYVGTALDDIQWGALLHSASAFEEYRRNHGRIKPQLVAEFLLLDRCFPRSVLFCLESARASLSALAGRTDPCAPGADPDGPAERLLGKLAATISYTCMQEIMDAGLHEFIDDMQTQLNNIHLAIHERYFALPPRVIHVDAEPARQA